MPAGQPPKPAEVKRLTGNPGRRALPSLAEVAPLPMATATPEPPAELREDGLSLWNQAWATAITWLSPDSDMKAVVHACLLADDLAVARARYRATTEPADGRILVNLSDAFAKSLSALGFDPVSRTRLGVAEVKRVSAIDELLAKRNAR